VNRLFFSLCASAVGCAFALQFPATAIAKSKETVLHSFGSGTDGEHPWASLIDVKRTLYGTTPEGGTDGGGTVFSVNPKTGAETVVYSFCSQQYCADGLYPLASLIDMKGTLYGATFDGGTDDYGTVFSVNPNTGAETVLHSFGSGTDGATPLASLIDVNGMLFGTTNGGGTSAWGTVFSVNPNTGAETVVYSFLGGTDGEYPKASLIDVKGALYGTTEFGGTYDNGTVFSVNPNTGAETVLHSFGSGADGEYPIASLIDVKGTLYGTTEEGGTYGGGTVFSLSLTTGTETVLHSFGGGTDGNTPVASLINVKRTLYSTTAGGGTYGDGTVFSVNPKTGAETVLHSFGSGTDGEYPEASLIDVKGALYGTTEVGGTYGSGTVFALRKP